MKWIQVNANSLNESFELWKDEQKLAHVTFNKLTQVVRLVSDHGMRLFFFKKRGIINPRLVITNEYGIQIGKLEMDRNSIQKGWMEIDNNKFSYQFNDNNSLSLFDETAHHQLGNCSFQLLFTSFSVNHTFINTNIPSLLLMLCWYSSIPHARPYTGAAA